VPPREGGPGASSAPDAVDVDRDRAVTLTWADGTTTTVALDDLRQACPCASCRTRREQGHPAWSPTPGAAPLQIADAHLVGNWGLGVTWNDGHRTGIYSWELLRGE